MLKGKTQKELLKLSKNLVQPLLPHFYKGQAGKIGVIGGCEDFTGAPFFAAHSAALCGSDLTHVVCEKLASPVIKSYSADLMVHPYLYELSNPEIRPFFSDSDWESLRHSSLEEVIRKDYKKLDSFIEQQVLPKVVAILNRLDLVILGPGLGRDLLMAKTLIKIIEQIKVLNKPMILDADALFIVALDPSIIKNYPKATVTPNLIEFERIGKKLGLPSLLKEQSTDKILDTTIEFSKKLGGITVVRKGNPEFIVRGDAYLLNTMKGSNKRVGGQGDSLAGALATFTNWAYNYQDGLWTTDGDKISLDESLVLSSYAASTIVRVAANKAFRKYGRALQTSNLHEFLGDAYSELYESDDFIKL